METPFAGVFRPQKATARPLLRVWHYVAPQNRHKTDLARIAVPPARALFPEPAARCAIDPPPHFRYPSASQEKIISPRKAYLKQVE